MTRSVPRFRSIFLSRLNRWLVVAIIFTAVAHFLVVNDLSTKGFLFKDFKVKNNELISERQSMESVVSSLASYQSLNPRIQALHLVAADNVRYLSWDESLVAKK